MSESGRLIVLYGSQTYTAQEAAERIWRMTKNLGFRGPVLALDNYPISQLIREEFAIFVVATAGQGDEPDNMKRFWKFLLRKNLPSNSLAKLKYGVLGFGDSSFVKFNFAAKKLHKRLAQLGATPLLDIGLCDYQHDLGHDAVKTPWLMEYISKLKYFFPHMHTENLNRFVPRWKVSLIKEFHLLSYNNIVSNNLSKDIYFEDCATDTYLGACQVVVDKNERTTDESHFQDVRLITLKTTGDTELHYKPGDVFNIIPRNSREDIVNLFSIFKEHNIDIRPEYKLLVEEYHEGPERAAVIGGFSGGANTASAQDDEYRYAGVQDPKIMITTSREPSARLKMFVKELRLIFPNSQRMNRGGFQIPQLIRACRANEVTDFIVVHEHRGVPDSLIICHLPHGPTASFTLSGVVMRHDIPDIGPMTEQYPHLIFHNFKTELDMPVPEFLQRRRTLYEIAEQYWDLKCYPTQYVFSLLAQVSEDKLEREKCMELASAEGQEDWLNYARRPRRTILEVLRDFHKSTSKLTLEVIFELFSIIKPRSFSIASSSLPSRGHCIELLVAVVHYSTMLKKPRLGLASNWLKDLWPGDKLYGWIKQGTLVFPDDLNIPHIQIAPGTGLAPFRSFLQERECRNIAHKDTLHLFFGCRYKEKDFHCRDELERMVRDNKLNLYCAFSRDQDRKIYVQHKISEHRELLWHLINNRAHIYISGNAKNMPDNVKDAFIEDVISKCGGYSLEEARTILKKMEDTGRLQIEAW